MKLQTDLFPYPVLNKNLDDYVKSEFSANFEINPVTSINYELKVHFNLEDEELEKLILKGKACFSVHIEGISSSYRQLYVLPKYEKSIKIPLEAGQVSERLEVNFMLIAKKTIENYTNTNFNTLYYGDNYSVNNLAKGDILAFDEMLNLNLSFENQENIGAKSMIRIGLTTQNLMLVDISGDVIYVYLPEKDYNAYIKLSTSNEIHKQLLLNTVVLPALTYTLERVAERQIDYSNKWTESMENMLLNIGSSFDELASDPSQSLKLAQKLLNEPMKDAINNYYEEESRHEY